MLNATDVGQRETNTFSNEANYCQLQFEYSVLNIQPPKLLTSKKHRFLATINLGKLGIIHRAWSWSIVCPDLSVSFPQPASSKSLSLKKRFGSANHAATSSGQIIVVNPGNPLLNPLIGGGCVTFL